MLIISDTNILSSMVAADALDLLWHLFPKSVISIPPTVLNELEIGLNKGRTHLNPVLQAIATNQIEVLQLSEPEQLLIASFPRKLNLGEREAIALAQHRDVPLLSNDQRAVRYCQRESIDVLDLADLLRALWTRHLISQAEVRQLIQKMERVEKLILTKKVRAKIFAPRRRRGKS